MQLLWMLLTVKQQEKKKPVTVRSATERWKRAVPSVRERESEGERARETPTSAAVGDVRKGEADGKHRRIRPPTQLVATTTREDSALSVSASTIGTFFFCEVERSGEAIQVMKKNCKPACRSFLTACRAWIRRRRLVLTLESGSWARQASRIPSEICREERG